MRNLINSTYITLDGVIEGPHLWPSIGDAGSQVSFGIQNDLLQSCDGVLMGRCTYESFAAAWSTRSGDSFSDRMNAMRKHVASSTLRAPSWNNTSVIDGDLVEAVRRMKAEPGKDIVQYGIGSVSFALMAHGLIDEFRLWIHPLILGAKGPRAPHFLDCVTTRFELVGARPLANGIVIATFKPHSG
jgi:dihydrofolate reductase